MALNYRIFVPNEYKNIASLPDFKARKNLGSKELSLQVMQNIYSSNKFYLTSA